MALKRKRTSSSTGKPYQVFLSFRGPDTRQGFADVLYHALTDAGIHVFRDYEEIRRGEYISDEIQMAIVGSKIFVPIFSRGYASSKWCLIELSEMFKSMEASPDSGKKILPVFYDVSVDDVKLKTELYNKALLEHREKKQFTPDKLQRWEEALQNVGMISGYEVKDRGHGEFIKMLVREISMKLKVKLKDVAEYLVERDNQVKALMDLLDIEASGIRFVGIWGMGGIGKTTLAKIVFNEIRNHYEPSCFLDDVRESCRQHKGIQKLQKQLLSSLSPTLGDIMDEDDGIVKMKEMFLEKKVLIVLDDVDDWEQINKLARDATWFGQGSRIIVTTRNKGALKEKFQTLEVAPMERKEALRLFSMHAFRKDSPPKKYRKLSKEAVASTGRLPLALKVIGSHLGDQPRKDWARIIEGLKKIPHEKVQQKLRISYEALDDETKQMFLDIACFFIGHEKTFPLYMWDTCEFNAKMGLRVLDHMSLVKIDVEKDTLEPEQLKVEKLWMHDQLRDLGREIVRVESSKNGVKCNRLWMHEDNFEMLHEEEVKTNIKMLRLYSPENDSTDLYKHNFSKGEFSGFRKLRYLECRRARITGDWSRLLPELRWLFCVDCFVDVDFTCSSLKNLAVLDLSRCSISEDWSGWSQIGVGDKLKVLDLSYTYLRRTPDLSKFPCLERLILVDCIDLVEIDPSIGKLKGLKFLNVSGCKSLKGFPNELCFLSHLEVIIRHGSGEAFALSKIDSSRKEFTDRDLHVIFQAHDFDRPRVEFFYMPESIGDLGSLSTLVLDNSPITELPESIGRLSKLRLLSLSDCWCLRRLPDSLADIKSLVKLHLSFAKIYELPQRVGQLVKLKSLKLRHCHKMKKLPDSIGTMKSLVELDLSESGIIQLPATIGMLKTLEIVHARGCESLEEIPSTIGGCTSLRDLDLGYCDNIEKLPDSVWDLRLLAELTLSYTRINELPDSMENLEELRVIRLDATRIRKLPTSTGMLQSLEELHVYKCEFLTEIPSEVEGCTSLRVLDLRGTGVNLLPPKLPVSLIDVRTDWDK